MLKLIVATTLTLPVFGGIITQTTTCFVSNTVGSTQSASGPTNCSLSLPIGGGPAMITAQASDTASFFSVSAIVTGFDGDPARASSSASAMAHENYSVLTTGPSRPGFLALTYFIDGGRGPILPGMGFANISIPGILGIDQSNLGRFDSLTAFCSGMIASCTAPVTLGQIYAFDLAASASGANGDTGFAASGSARLTFQFFEADRTTAVAALVDAPEPTTLWLMAGIGVLGLARRRT